jgi:hypothetical protein
MHAEKNIYPKLLLCQIPLFSWNAFNILREIKLNLYICLFVLINEIQIRRKTTIIIIKKKRRWFTALII